MTGTPRRKLEDIILEADLLSEDRLKEAQSAQKETGRHLHQVLVEDGYLEEPQLMACMSQQLGIPLIALSRFRIDPVLAGLVPENLARNYQVIPLAKLGNTLTLCMSDPMNVIAVDDVRMSTGFHIEPALASAKDIAEAIERCYTQDSAIEEFLQDLQEEDLEVMHAVTDDDRADGDVAVSLEETPVVKLANFIVQDGVRKKASDILIEPWEHSCRTRLRVDGILQETVAPPRSMYDSLVARIKIMSELDIAERRMPQDGRFRATVDGHDVDFRVSTLPSSFGEKVVIRLLDTQTQKQDMDALGFEPEPLADMAAAAARPHGMILITGPTGSGKTSTLYSMLRRVDDPSVNIVTVEDPVEYELYGVNQVAVRHEVDLTFAAALRAILRQDPDIILVGEIRDYETVDVAIKAALTGHLVLSTLHTTNAAGAITRLVNMGVEPFLISSSLVLVAAQRLVRRLCKRCREAYEMPEETADRIGLTEEERSATFYRPVGCSHCDDRGYSGRTAVCEALPVDQRIRDLVMERASTSRIMRAAREAGMRSLRQNAMRKAVAGETSIEEILRVTADDSMMPSEREEEGVVSVSAREGQLLGAESAVEAARGVDMTSVEARTAIRDLVREEVEGLAGTAGAPAASVSEEHVREVVRSEMESAVASAPSPLRPHEITALVSRAVAEAQADAPGPLGREEVAAIAADEAKRLLESSRGATSTEQIRQMVTAAVEEITPGAGSGPSADLDERIDRAVSRAVANLPQPMRPHEVTEMVGRSVKEAVARLSGGVDAGPAPGRDVAAPPEDVEAAALSLIEERLAQLPAPPSIEELQSAAAKLVDERLAALGEPPTPEQIKEWARQAAAETRGALPVGPSPEEIVEMVERAVEAAAEGLTSGSPAALSEAEIRRIAEEAFSEKAAQMAPAPTGVEISALVSDAVDRALSALPESVPRNEIEEMIGGAVLDALSEMESSVQKALGEEEARSLVRAEMEVALSTLADSPDRDEVRRLVEEALSDALARIPDRDAVEGIAAEQVGAALSGLGDTVRKEEVEGLIAAALASHAASVESEFRSELETKLTQAISKAASPEQVREAVAAAVSQMGDVVRRSELDEVSESLAGLEGRLSEAAAAAVTPEQVREAVAGALSELGDVVRKSELAELRRALGGENAELRERITGLQTELQAELRKAVEGAVEPGQVREAIDKAVAGMGKLAGRDELDGLAADLRKAADATKERLSALEDLLSEQAERAVSAAEVEAAVSSAVKPWADKLSDAVGAEELERRLGEALETQERRQADRLSSDILAEVDARISRLTAGLPDVPGANEIAEAAKEAVARALDARPQPVPREEIERMAATAARGATAAAEKSLEGAVGRDGVEAMIEDALGKAAAGMEDRVTREEMKSLLEETVSSQSKKTEERLRTEMEVHLSAAIDEAVSEEEVAAMVRQAVSGLSDTVRRDEFRQAMDEALARQRSQIEDAFKVALEQKLRGALAEVAAPPSKDEVAAWAAAAAAERVAALPEAPTAEQIRRMVEDAVSAALAASPEPTGRAEVEGMIRTAVDAARKELLAGQVDLPTAKEVEALVRKGVEKALSSLPDAVRREEMESAIKRAVAASGEEVTARLSRQLAEKVEDGVRRAKSGAEAKADEALRVARDSAEGVLAHISRELRSALAEMPSAPTAEETARMVRDSVREALAAAGPGASLDEVRALVREMVAHAAEEWRPSLGETELRPLVERLVADALENKPVSVTPSDIARVVREAVAAGTAEAVRRTAEASEDHDGSGGGR